MSLSLLSTTSWAEQFPDILDVVVQHANYATSLRLRAVCRYLCERVESEFSVHLIWRHDAVYTKLSTGEEWRHPLSCFNAVNVQSGTAGVKGVDHNVEDTWPLSAFRFTKAVDVYCPMNHGFRRVPRDEIHIPLLRIWAAKLSGHGLPWDTRDEIQITLMRMWAETLPEEERPKLNVFPPILNSRNFKMDTIVFRGQGPLTAEYHPRVGMAAFRPPRRVVIHLDGATFDISIVIRLCGRAQADEDYPANSEVVLVAQPHMLWYQYDMSIIDVFRLLFQESARVFDRYVIVEDPKAVLSKDTALEVCTVLGLEWKSPTSAAFSDIVRHYLRNKSDASVASKIRYIAIDEWKAELGDERFELEMGD